MLMSKLLGERLKERPADAVMASHIFLLRGGYIRQVGQGIYSMLPPARRILRRIEEIIRSEMDALGGQEVLFPVVLPAELWQQSGRLQQIGPELARFSDRSGREMVLGMTHEEAAVHLARSEAKSYQQYPFMIYQIQTKFRDEPRSRGGLVRVREFTMKDAYSFHRGEQDCQDFYADMLEAYKRIFVRCGLTDVIDVQSSSGMMGGSMAHEFMFPSDDGEDRLAVCSSCDYRSNLDVAFYRHEPETNQSADGYHAEEVTEISTPGIRTIAALTDFLGLDAKSMIKAAAFRRLDNGRQLIVFLRADRQVNETKLKAMLQSEITPLDQQTDLYLGFIGPYQLHAPMTDIYFDQSLRGAQNMICGANKPDMHYQGIYMERDLPETSFNELSLVQDGDACPMCGKPLRLRRGIEVGNIFQLGTRYSRSMQMTYMDETGQSQVPLMGCYGIGLGRLLACVLEQHHDQNGPIWPPAVTPWDLHICLINSQDPAVLQAGTMLYKQLSEKWDVVLDDRPVRAGVQFADADLLGLPWRIIIGQRNLQNGQVEISPRSSGEAQLVDINQVAAFFQDMLNEE